MVRLNWMVVGEEKKWRKKGKRNGLDNSHSLLHLKDCTVSVCRGKKMGSE